MLTMPYRYLEDIAIADVAFEAWGDTLERMFIAAADATMNVMVDDLRAIEPREHRTLDLEADAIDLLLFQLLQELVYYKDAEQLLLRVAAVHIHAHGDGFVVHGEAQGEEINPDRHELLVDVKAVTLHQFQVEQNQDGWKALVILDI
jgi:SHS2 domain-containing protein